MADERLHLRRKRLTGGTVTCWGTGLRAETTPANPREPAPPAPLPDVTNAAQVALGAPSPSGCVLLNDGTVARWGIGTSNGQLNSLGYPEWSETPVAVPGLVGVIQLVGGNFWACALRQAGDVVCWDKSSVKQEASPATGAIAPLQNIPGLAGVTKISGYGFELYAVTNTGRVFHVRALPGFGPPEAVADVDEALSIAGTSSPVPTRSGTVRCWGTNDLGQLGNGEVAPPAERQKASTVQLAPAPLFKLRASGAYDGQHCACGAVVLRLVDGVAEVALVLVFGADVLHAVPLMAP